MNDLSIIKRKQVHSFVSNELLRTKKISFFINITLIVLSYVGITVWLNNVRTTGQLWFVWVLIIIQLILYFAIFSTSYLRFKECGYKRFGSILFVVLALIGRINDWEFLIIPLLVVTMLIISAKSKYQTDKKTQ